MSYAPEWQQAKIRSYTEAYVRLWIRGLSLSFWDWTLSYDETKVEKSEHGAGSDTIITMCCRASWEYQEIVIWIDLDACASLLDWSDQDAFERVLESWVVHELCHAVVAPLRCETENEARVQRRQEEYVVSMLTTSFQWIRQHADDPEWQPEVKDDRKIEAERALLLDQLRELTVPLDDLRALADRLHTENADGD